MTISDTTIGSEAPDAARQDRDPAADLIAAAAEIGSTILAADADEAVRLARPTDRVIAALDDAGLLMLCAPKIRGGHEVSLRTFIAVHEELSKGCASTSWVSGVANGALYMMAPFPDEAQDEVYSVGHPKSVAAFNPAGQAVAVPGGYRLSGTWRFCTGQHHANWALLSSLIVGDDSLPEPAQFIVPRSECHVHDDWQVTGLAGTGSNTMSVEDVFVPAHRALRLSIPGSGQTRSEALASNNYFKMPAIPFFATGSAGTPLGLASAALDLMRERVQKRGITYSHYARQAEAAITHFQLDEATMKLDQARFHAARAADTVLEVTEDLGNISHRVRCRSDIAWATKLCREVVEIVQQSSGASSIHKRDPLGRIVADIQALSLHSFLLFNTNAELHGRVLAGLEPEVPFI